MHIFLFINKYYEIPFQLTTPYILVRKIKSLIHLDTFFENINSIEKKEINVK